MKKMKKQLVKLLNIHSVSGNEKPVRDYLKPILSNLMDEVTVDSYGNLLGQKKIGTGNGATVMLSAHMDTVKGVFADRELVFTNEWIQSSVGALGADDKAGISIIMEVLRNIDNTEFNGTLKIAFSREEEIGCIGARAIDENWYSDVDLAIVVDRRGSRDIVTGCYGAFCCNEVGYYLEGVSASLGMNWRAVEGGISDADVFSTNGINSVNLSAGYYGEHTNKECVSLVEMMDTVMLITETFNTINEYVDSFTVVPSSNAWSESYSYTKKSSKSSKSWQSYYTQEELDYYYDQFGVQYQDEPQSTFEDMIYAEQNDSYGDVYVYECREGVVIEQGTNEIVMSKESLNSLIQQLTKEVIKK